MRKTIFMVLAVVSGSAMAEWAKISESDYASFYVDPVTIHTTVNKIIMWDLVDLKKPEIVRGKSYFSLIEQIEYDCKDNQTRTIQYAYYSGNMGSGREVVAVNSHEYENSKWVAVPPGSVEKLLLKVACGRYPPCQPLWAVPYDCRANA